MVKTELMVASELRAAALNRGQAALHAVAAARASVVEAENAQITAQDRLNALAGSHAAGTIMPAPEDVGAALDSLEAANRGTVWAAAVLAAATRELQTAQDEMRDATAEHEAASALAARAALKSRVRELVSGNA